MNSLKLLLVGLFLLSLNALYAQNSLMHTITIYSELDAPFTVSVNGEVMNETPQKRVKFDTHLDYGHAIVTFENPDRSPAVRKLFLMGSYASTDRAAAVVYKIIKKEKKRRNVVTTEYHLRYVSHANKVPAAIIIQQPTPQSTPTNNNGTNINIQGRIGR